MNRLNESRRTRGLNRPNAAFRRLGAPAEECEFLNPVLAATRAPPINRTSAATIRTIDGREPDALDASRGLFF
jgi:hypothetical protein